MSNEAMRQALEALRELFEAVCGETGFAQAVRAESGFAYPWPALDNAEAKARAAIPALQEALANDADDSELLNIAWMDGSHRSTKAHRATISGLQGEIADLREKLAVAYVALSGTDTHASDCATSNAPAFEPGPCDCLPTPPGEQK